MQKILVTGMPFSGKTFVADYLKRQNLNVVDVDEIDGLGNWFDRSGKKVKFSKNADKTWLRKHVYKWDEKILRIWLAKQKADIYIFGLAANTLDLIDLFDRVYYLDVSKELLRKRFAGNGRANIMGQTKEQQEAILEDLDNFWEQARKSGLIFIKADKKPREIYREIKNNG